MATVVAGESMEIPTGGPATIVRLIARETAPIVAVICTDAGVVVTGAWYRMERPAGVAGTMVTSCLPVIPVAYIAITEPAPTVVDAVNAPLDVIVPLPPVTLHRSGTFAIGLPNRSVVSATNVRSAPAGMSTGPSKRLLPTRMTT